MSSQRAVGVGKLGSLWGNLRIRIGIGAWHSQKQSFITWHRPVIHCQIMLTSMAVSLELAHLVRISNGSLRGKRVADYSPRN